MYSTNYDLGWLITPDEYYDFSDYLNINPSDKKYNDTMNKLMAKAG